VIYNCGEKFVDLFRQDNCQILLARWANIIDKRDERLEYLRVFSCIFVVLGHIANWYMREYPDIAMNSYMCGLLLNGICRISVPIFFMISGALLLEQNIDYKKNTKRAVSMLIKTVMWGILFLLWDYMYLGDGYSFKMLFAVPVRVHFWYMYVMIGIYITVPLWQKLVGGDSKTLLKYFAIVFIAITAINSLLHSTKFTVSYDVPLIGSSCYAGYFIMGYAIRHYIDEIKIKKWICTLVLAISVTATIVLTYYFSVRERTHIEIFSDFRSIFVALASMTVFYLVMKYGKFKSSLWVRIMSKHSFNIYMIHVFFLDILQQNIDVTTVNAWWGTPVFLVFMISMSLAVSWFYETLKGKRPTII